MRGDLGPFRRVPRLAVSSSSIRAGRRRAPLRRIIWRANLPSIVPMARPRVSPPLAARALTTASCGTATVWTAGFGSPAREGHRATRPRPRPWRTAGVPRERC